MRKVPGLRGSPIRGGVWEAEVTGGDPWMLSGWGTLTVEVTTPPLSLVDTFLPGGRGPS